MSEYQNDEVLVEKIRTTDKELYREILTRYQQKLFTYAKYITRDDELAKDAVQETFIKAYKNLNSFDIRKKFSSWIYRITHNESINILKKHKHELDLPEESLLPRTDAKHIERQLELEENNELLLKHVDGLPLMYKEIIVLYFLDEKSYEEISDILRIPMGTVAIRLSRAKERLRELMQ